MASIAAVVVVAASVGVSSVSAGTAVPVWPSASAVTLPAHATDPGGYLASVACASAGNCVGVGNYEDASSHEQAMVVGESGGVWASASKVTLPAAAANPYASLDSVACASVGNCVAIGDYYDASSNEQAMVVGESAGVWGSASEVTLPAHATNPDAYLDSVACTSVGSCVAVGEYVDASSHEQAMVVVESAGVWGSASEVTLPTAATDPDGTLASVACASVGNCVAVGTYNDASSHGQAMVVGESAGVWGSASEVTLPAHNTNPGADLSSVACASTGNCVAVGGYDGDEAMVVVESGGVWGSGSQVAPASAGSGGADLKSVVCPSKGDCVAVGYYNDASSHAQAMVVGESGGVWASASAVTLPAHATDPGAYLGSVACASVGNCVAVGDYYDPSSNEQAMVVAESAGVWGSASEVTLPGGATGPDAYLKSVACTSVGNCVGVGSYEDVSSHEQAMVVGSVASLAVVTSGLPSAAVGAAYGAQLAASGGAGSYTWSLSSGSLPAGLSLSAASGVISGTPTATGTASFTVGVSDPGPPGQQAGAALSIVVGGPSIAKVKTKGRKVMVTVSCGAVAGQSCTGTLALTIVEHLKGPTITALTATKKPKKPKRRIRTVTLAKTSYDVAGATSKTLTITLNATARRLLAEYHKLPAKLSLTPTGIMTATTTANVTIKPAKPKAKHHP